MISEALSFTWRTTIEYVYVGASDPEAINVQPIYQSIHSDTMHEGQTTSATTQSNVLGRVSRTNVYRTRGVGKGVVWVGPCVLIDRGYSIRDRRVERRA